MFLRFELIGVFLAPEHVGYCFYHDADVEQESPVLNIPQVSSYPAFHLGKFLWFLPDQPVTCAHPVIPGLTRWRIMYLLISWEYSSVCFSIWGLGPTIDISTFENINELRQFVQIALSQEVAELGLAGIILGSLQ